MAYQEIKYPFHSCPTCGPLGTNYGLIYDPTTGDYQIKEKNPITGYNTNAYLYENGSFRNAAIDDPSLFKRTGVLPGQYQKLPFADELNKKAKEEVWKAYQTGGGATKGLKINNSARPANQNDPTGINNSAPGTNPGLSTALSPMGTLQNILETFEPGLKDLQDLVNKSFSSVNEDKLFSGILKYPFDILDNQQDTLQIQMFNYQAPYGESFVKQQSIQEIQSMAMNGLKRNSALKNTLGTVILPIPSGIQDSNTIGWGDDRMSAINAAVTNMAINNPTGTLATIAGSYGAGTATGISGQTLANIALMNAAGGLNNKLLKPAVMSLLLKAAAFDIPAETILSRGLGVIPNSNLELLFNGPTLRQFGFNWRMSPRNEPEAANVRRIIRFFKQGSAPRKANPNNSASNSLLLGTPNVFKLRYVKPGKQDIPGLNKFKICALTNIQVVYAPDGQWAAYEDSQPVSLTMTLTFQEIEPIYESDYQPDNPLINLNQGDNQPVYDGDVGY